MKSAAVRFDEIGKRYGAQWVVRAGEVVLFHDDTAATVDSMPALLDRFKRTQLELAPLL